MVLPLLTLVLTVAGAGAQSSESIPHTVPPTDQAALPLSSGKLVEERDLYRSALQSNPRDAVAQQGLVEASERLALDARAHGDNDEALRTLLAAQQFAPLNHKLLYDLGVLEDSMGLYWDADANVTKLVDNSANDPQTLYLAARIKLDLGQLEIAERQMRAYLKLMPEDASAHYGLGRILQMGQQPDLARAEFQQSIELQPRQTESFYQLGEIALSQAHYDEALAAYNHALTKDPLHGGALTGIGIVLFRLKQYDKAADTLVRAIAAAPTYQPAHYYLGLTLSRLGRKADADRELARAAQMAAADSQRDAQRLHLQQGAAAHGPS
jgi:tetratricopeptide (TPR) repeat protein